MRLPLQLVRLIGLMTLGCIMLIGKTLAQASGEKPYTEISPPQLASPTNKIEVVEVFSYACIHCAHFQRYVDEWRTRSRNAAKVEFVYVPSPYNPVYELLARGHYAAAALGVVAKTHQSLFNAIHEQGVAIRSFSDVAAIYAGLGVNRQEFENAAKSFLVDTQVRRANELMRLWRIESTPTLIVAGKYRITPDTAGSQENMFNIVDQLIAKESSQSRTTSRQAPSKGK